MPMLGDVYNIPIRGTFHKNPHPHVVALVISQECLIVPCFTTGGAEVESSILDQQNLFGLRGNALKVSLDNSTCVEWMGGLGKTGHESLWLPWRVERIAACDLPKNSPGTMLDECVEDILIGLVAFKDQRPDRFSLTTRSLLDAALATVKSRLAAKAATR